MKKKQKEEDKELLGFNSGVFYAMQYLVLEQDQPTFAAEIARESGMTKEFALKESKKTGYQVREMNKFIRKEL